MQVYIALTRPTPGFIVSERREHLAWHGLATPAFSPPPLQAISLQALREGVQTPGRKLARLFRGLDDLQSALVAVFELYADAVTQHFAAESLRGQFLVRLVDETPPMLGLMRWPLIDAESTQLLYNLSEGTGGGSIGVPAALAASVRVDHQPEQRTVIAIEQQPDGKWRLAGDGQTDAAGGAVLELSVTPSSRVYTLCLDEWGVLYEPNLLVDVGDTIRPSTFAGWLYRVTEAGMLPASEPTWWDDSFTGSQQLGTARAEVVRYYQPLAHGPIPVEIL